MRKKSLLILAATVVLTLGTGVSAAFAASGWEMLNNNWVYYDSYGGVVTNEWRKGADDKWRYLDGSGYMAVNTWADDGYYVDANGIMVADKWLQLSSSINGTMDETRWYYFSGSGRAVMNTWKKINDKWYYFDSDGSMMTGWVDEDMFYCGDDGAAKTGWQKLYPPDDGDDWDDRVTPESDDDDGKSWYYFSTSGKKYVPDLSDGSEYGEKRIDSTYYCFDSTGAMQTGWLYVGTGAKENGSIVDCRFYGSDGKVKTGWYSAEPPEFLKGYEDEVEWFYFSKSGVPKAGEEGNGSLQGDFVKLNGKTYLFNELGNPVYGLQRVSTSGDEVTAYYFGNKATSSMQTGRQKIEEGDGTISEFYFTQTGRGFTGVYNNYLYYMGKLQKAEDGIRYQIISLPTGDNFNNYLVNSSGRVMKSSSGVKDADGVKYTTNSGGIVQKIDDREAGSGHFHSPSEPAWSR